MGAHRDKVIKLSPDPGVLYLATVADTMAAQLTVLTERVNSCCGSELTAPAAMKPAERSAPPAKPETPTE